ncbi:MAG: hypothetical protein BWX88_04951 [Planctomycetes bacterium ADurb.Bin126]|nr:MAG: hypothetical protein BWX88_04951 [Planctomycetes bacterium ADurb.Bin126]HOD81814.1 hypothetical protein [Phycisphaerae bacterium]HQL75534.1 hypothetical protein [Phycisphaerae bacterium]
MARAADKSAFTQPGTLDQLANRADLQHGDGTARGDPGGNACDEPAFQIGLIAVGCLLGILLGGGCALQGLEVHGMSGWQAKAQTPCFSPDGQWMAYAVNERVFHEARWYKYDLFGHDSYKVLWGSHDCRLKVEWVSIHDPRQVRSVGLGRREPYRRIIMLCFSPDSGRLAVLERDRITTIDLTTRECQVVHVVDDTAKAIAWISDTKQAYLTQQGLWRRQAQGDQRGELVVPLNLLSRGGKDPPFPSSRESYNVWGDAHVSPRGRYMVAHAQTFDRAGPAWVVDVQNVRAMELTFPHFSSLDRTDLAWKPNETALVIVPYPTPDWSKIDARTASRQAAETIRPAMLVDLERWEHRDVTDRLARVSGGKYYSCPLWSEDGRILVVDLGEKWAEVSPKTWEFTIHEGSYQWPAWNRKNWKEVYRRTCRLDARYEGTSGDRYPSPFSPHVAEHSLTKGQAHLTLYEIHPL